MTSDEIVGITHCTLHETHYKGMGWPDGEKCPGASRVTLKPEHRFCKTHGITFVGDAATCVVAKLIRAAARVAADCEPVSALLVVEEDNAS